MNVGFIGSRKILHKTLNFFTINQQCRFVHHHKEYEKNKDVYLGVYRSNPARANRNTHLNEKHLRRARSRKTLFIELPDDVERRNQEKMAPDEIRLALLKKGINPFKDISPREWSEQQLTMQSFYQLLDSYVPLENSQSWKSLTNKKNEMTERFKNKFYNFWHGTRRIKKKVGFEKFDPKKFGPTAENIYVLAHQALIERNKPLMHKYLTENAFSLWPEVEKGTVVWELVRFNEPSQVITVRCSDNPYKSGNDIAQLTVRMHSTQKLAIYDRFGHLLLGSENQPKDCVEYVVFENHIASVDGLWRLHEKVYPSWLKLKQGIVSNTNSDNEEEKNLLLELKPLNLGFSKKIEEQEKKNERQKQLGIKPK